MEHHEVMHLETRIKALSQSLASVADDKDLKELLLIIHRPGWTTPAERQLVQGVIEAMHGHIQVFQGLKQALMAGSRQVDLKP